MRRCSVLTTVKFWDDKRTIIAEVGSSDLTTVKIGFVGECYFPF